MPGTARLICLTAGLAAAECSDPKVPTGPAAADSAALKKEADLHKRMHDRNAHGR